MNISDIWVFFGIAKSLGMFMLNREYAIKDFGKSRLFSLQNELYAKDSIIFSLVYGLRRGNH